MQLLRSIQKVIPAFLSSEMPENMPEDDLYRQNLYQYRRRIALLCWFAFALCLSFSSCSSSQPYRWQSDQINSPFPSCELSQKRINIGAQFLPIEVEVVNGPSGRHVYLNGTNVIFPRTSMEFQTAAAEVNLIIGEKNYKFLAKCFRGDQRLLLPGWVADLLLSALDNNEIITIDAAML